ncbi:hypothetical protein [Paludisphaera mucosa]|uniref:DUF3887 domain-containing protein n=1 Tax=Paludisphaera mucosa TaxID=3030827 RepID=A0ABT6FKB0_9BACT|nr:hypothetical protein [Paludisphaera mucosa]MDG3007974.1 hypothetical protein [Paludisphaera mucosa]
MRLWRKALLIGLALGLSAFLGVSVWGVRVYRHQPADAARAAEQFADLAVVRSDVAGSYARIAPEFQRTISEERLGDAVAKMHPAGRPKEVRATEYEPMPGQAAMMIFLKGTRGDESFFYRFMMLGDQPSGYRVGGFWRGSGPYPPSARKAL